MIPVNDLARRLRPISERLEAAAARVVRSGWVVLGPEVERFEAEFAAAVGVRACVGVANGTDALELALRAVGVEPGDRVATVANAGGYSTTAIRALGAEPRYVEIDPRSGLLDPEALAPEVENGAPKAIVVTHLYGRLVELAPVLDLARRRGVAVIEDCAQAHGASRDGRRAGSFGDAAAFSFYPTKNLGAIGDGGAVVTDRPEIAESVRQLRQYGWRSRYHAVRRGGRNSRLDELQAAFLLEMLPLLDGWNERRRAIAAAYRKALAGSPVECTASAADGLDDVAHLFVLRTSRRAALREALKARGVATDVHYPTPDYAQPCEPPAALRLSATERWCETVLTLPCFPELTDAEVEQVATAAGAAAREVEPLLASDPPCEAGARR